MKTFMLGWEFPPFISGGLGTACYGLTKAMSQLGIDVTLVLPHVPSNRGASHVKILNASDQPKLSSTHLSKIQICRIESPLQPYGTPATYQREVSGSQVPLSGRTQPHDQHGSIRSKGTHTYGDDLYAEVNRYANAAARFADSEQFDVIHAHDWMTYPAGMAAAATSGKPLLVHVHSTEFDRSGENINQIVYDVERQGMHAADRVIAVSHFTRDIITGRYGVPPEKVAVVHNGVEPDSGPLQELPHPRLAKGDKIVLFLGRITMQKGPEYFLAAAKKVLGVMDNVKFIMAGTGDMMVRTIELAAELGIGHRVLFAGFLKGGDVRRAYQMADLYVMPSVSEPFGIAPLEAAQQDVPVLISKQSGVSEVLSHALKVDFWDIDEMANKIIGVLQRPALQATLRENGRYEAAQLRWEDAAAKCKKVYEESLAAA